MSWQEINGDFLFALRTEKTMMFFVLVFILLIAAFSITSALLIAVVRKTGEIGLLRALGATANGCAACFLLQGFAIGAIGSTLGIVFGTVVLRFRNGIVALFTGLCGVEDFMAKFYAFSHMPAHYDCGDVIWVMGLATVLCCMAGVVPAMRAARINPAEALRNE
jgi:lipoprotein-releasing system permease protein